MIKETKKKIYFVSYTKKKQIKEEKVPYVTVNIKHKLVTFYRSLIDELDMNEKFIKLFYVAGKKIVGWQIIDKGYQNSENLRDYRLVKQNKINGNYTLSIAPLLNEMGSFKEPSYRCEVMRYREVSDILSKGDIYYYFEIKNEKSSS